MRLIKYFVDHRTAANLAMVLILAIGFASFYSLNVQLFPTYEVKRITVKVSWRGASVGAMDRLVGHVLDTTLNAVRDVKNVRTSSYSGRTYASVRFNDDADMQIALSDVQSAVASITTFPKDIDQPVVTLRSPTEHVARVLISGPFSDAVKQQLSETIVKKFRAGGVSNVTVRGAPKLNLYVDVDPLLARQYGSNVEVITAAVRRAIHNNPGGSLESGTSSITTRMDATHDIKTLSDVLVSGSNGQFKVGDVATVSIATPTRQSRAVFPEGNGFFLNFSRNPSENALDVANKIRKTMVKIKAELPSTVSMRLYDVRADQIKDRLSLLGKNAALGLALVALTLFIFLNFRAAIWVVIGIPTAFAASFILMWVTGQTINMISAFAMVMILGIIVDDAIVVAENIVTRQATSATPAEGAFQGANAMWRPVFTATLTTIAAFAPIIFLTDSIGSYVKAIPYFVCVALIASLAECFFLLPGHMRHGGKTVAGKPKVSAFRAGIDRGFKWFVNVPFAKLIDMAFRLRYLSMAVAIGFVGLAVILAMTNSVRFQFWLNPQSNFLFANFTLSPGSSDKDTKQAVENLWQGLQKVEKDLGYKPYGLVKATFGLTGRTLSWGTRPTDPAVGSVLVELVDDGGERITSKAFVKKWREAIPPIAGLVSLEISQNRTGPDGADVDVTVKAQEADNLKRAIARLEASLREIDGVQNIRNSLTGTSTELQFALSQAGIERGFSGQDVGRQIFSGLTGQKADRIAKGDGFLDVIVRYKTSGEKGKAISDNVEDVLSYFPLKNGLGEEASFFDVATLSYGYSETILRRRNGELTASVKANVDRKKVDAPAVWKKLDATVLPAISSDEDVRFSYEGKRKERDRAMGEIELALIIGLIAIYCILAWSMESFMLPLAIMLVLPLGAAGAVIGHYVLDYKMTILSLVALVALFGVLVNDSIILFEEIRHQKRQGKDLRIATVKGYAARFRPVFLTSLTTVVGLGPLIFESGYQAQFLVPIAITITWGLAFATLMSFFLVPATVAIAGDLHLTKNNPHNKP